MGTSTKLEVIPVAGRIGAEIRGVRLSPVGVDGRRSKTRSAKHKHSPQPAHAEAVAAQA